MRDYKRKMDQYRLPQEQYKKLRAFCRTEEADPFILSALSQEFGEATDAMQWWIYHHVTRTDFTWAYMESRNIPCGKETFYFYRCKFYWYLAQVVDENGATS